MFTWFWTISRSPPQSSFSIHELTDNLETVLLEAIGFMNTDKVHLGQKLVQFKELT